MTHARATDGLRPLREDPAQIDADLALGAQLLQQVGGAARSEQRKRRVWHALSAGSPSPVGARLRALHLAFAALLVAAASSATLGYYVSRDVEPTPAPAPARIAPAADMPRPLGAPDTAAPAAEAPVPATPVLP